MGITAISGPQVVYGVTTTTSGAVTEYNEERGPSTFDMGYALLDPRPFYNYDPGNAVGTRVAVLFHGRGYVDYAPFTASSNLFATSSSQLLAGTLTIYSSKASLGSIPTTIFPPEGGAAVSVYALDSTAAQLVFPSTAGSGQVGGSIAAWNPNAGTGRGIQVTSVTCGIASVTIAGRDMYGFKVTETCSATSSDANNIIFTSKKTYKYISAITVSTAGAPAGTTSTGIGAGTVDTFGFPLLVRYTGIDVQYGISAGTSAAFALSVANITRGATATATSTTGDVRGTYVSSTATDGTLRIQMAINVNSPMAWGVLSSDTAAFPYFGVTQFSSV